MAEPTDPQELAKVQAQDLYNAAASSIDGLLDDFPNPTWDSMKMDTWLIDAVTHWSTCEENWSAAGVGSKEWYKLEYSLIARVPDLSMDKLDYNLDVVPLPVRRVQVKRSKVTVSPSHSCQDAAATHSRTITPAPVPAPSKATTPVPPSVTKTQALNAMMPRMQVAPTPAAKTPVTLPQLTQQQVKPRPITTGSTQGNTVMSTPQTPQPVFPSRPAAGPAIAKTGVPSSNSGPTGIDVSFPPDPTSPLHQKAGKPFNVGPPIHATRSMSSSNPTSSRLLIVDAATRSSVVPGPSPAREGSVAPSPDFPGPLFLPGTDDEDQPVQEDLAGAGLVDEGVAGTNGEDDESSDPSDEDGESPPPSNKARRLQKSRTEFVFDVLTGDFDPYPTIFLPRCSVVPPTQGTKFVATKKSKKNAKGKDTKAETVIPRKWSRPDDDDAPTVAKPASKKLKSSAHKVADDKVVRAMPAVRTRGPGPSKLPAVTLDVSGGEFGEKVPSSAKVIKNGLKSIGILEVEEDFGDFVKVDGRYWNKEVAPFVGERYTAPCDHCKRLGTQCRKFLTNTVICVRCHYLKLPCKVNGVPALNPINHYRPKSYQTLNAFEGALDTLAQHADSIEDIIVNYMAGLNALAQLNGLWVQAGRLRECATFDESDADEDDDNEAPDDVAEGVAGPSKKRKGKSG
ncbi:hypothetical protein EDD85DRAFT_952993 [Armillaria nabsnona]|nr:hypothetical protein EDD85DRAFT_952993 [Armillaria nabsnona]